MQYEVEAIIGKRYTQSDKKPQYLVKWKNYPIQESSWQPLKNLTNSQHYIQLYQMRNSLSAPISIVDYVPDAESELLSGQVDNDQSLQLSFKSQKKFQKNNQKSRIKEEKQSKAILTKQISAKKAGKKEIKSKGRSGNGVKIFQSIVREEKIYFKVLQEGKKVWRNRNYLLQFYPKQLCDFYEYLMLQRYQ